MGILTNSDLYVNKFDPTFDINPKTVGAVWFNYDTGKYFVCKDNTKEKNVWIDFMGELEKRIEAQVNKAIAAMGTVDAKIAQAITDHENKKSYIISSDRFKSTGYSGHINTQVNYVDNNTKTNHGIYFLTDQYRMNIDGGGGTKKTRYFQAAILHDYLYETGIYTRKESDKIFLEAMKAMNVSYFTRYLFYWSVRLFAKSHYNKK